MSTPANQLTLSSLQEKMKLIKLAISKW